MEDAFLTKQHAYHIHLCPVQLMSWQSAF